MLIPDSFHPRDCPEIFLQLIPECSGSFSMDDPDGPDTQHYRVVNVMDDDVKSVRHPFPTDIKLW